MKTFKHRVKLINYIIQKKSFNSYLEIGTAKCKTFDRITACEKKLGIDPAYEMRVRSDGSKSLKVASDDFFKSNTEQFNIIFIDGLHLYEQAARDIVNSWNCLTVGGFIILHDCQPYNAIVGGRNILKRGNWTGDVYKAIVWFREKFPEVVCRVLETDFGLGFIHKEINSKISLDEAELQLYMDYDFDWLTQNWNKIGLVEPSWCLDYLK